jgi:hypothetical protein
MMSQFAKVKVRPGGTVQFPGICANCARPAEDQMVIKRRSGRRTRYISVPLCPECHREIQKESGEEERLHRLGRFVTILVAVVVIIAVFLILGSQLHLLVRLFISLSIGALTGAVLVAYFRRVRADAAKDEKKAILGSIQLVHFSWRATTFEFQNDQFFDRFVELNQDALMEV